MSDTLFEFSKRLAYLDERIKKLQDSVSTSNASSVESEANTCEAYLKEHIYGFAQRHNIATGQYHFQLVSIQSRLEAVKMVIDNKPSRQGTLWKRVIGVIFNALGVISDILGIGSVIRPLLGVGSNIPLLPGD